MDAEWMQRDETRRDETRRTQAKSIRISMECGLGSVVDGSEDVGHYGCNGANLNNGTLCFYQQWGESLAHAHDLWSRWVKVSQQNGLSGEKETLGRRPHGTHGIDVGAKSCLDLIKV
jgi:hypothetical protein